MNNHATIRYNSEIRDSQLCYVHKYYLPLELRSKISPADIEGVRRCYEDECDVWEKRVAEKLDNCVITYKDLGMDKHIDGDAAQQVLLAYMAYIDDRRAELTSEENRVAMNLNSWLIDCEKQLSLLQKCIQKAEYF